MRRVIVALLAVATLLALPACGPLSDQRAEGAHAVLDTVTDVVDPLYQAAALGCDATEGVIVARESTREDDDRDLAEVREVCDRIFAAFEAVRQAQLAARAAIEAAREDAESTEAQEAAVQAVSALHDAAQAARGIWEEALPTLQAVTETAGGEAPPDV